MNRSYVCIKPLQVYSSNLIYCYGSWFRSHRAHPDTAAAGCKYRRLLWEEPRPQAVCSISSNMICRSVLTTSPLVGRIRFVLSAIVLTVTGTVLLISARNRKPDGSFSDVAIVNITKTSLQNQKVERTGFQKSIRRNHYHAFQLLSIYNNIIR